MVDPDCPKVDHINPCCEIELALPDRCNLREINFLDYFLDQVDSD